MIFTFDYDSSYSGPALPIAEASIRSLKPNSPTVTRSALVDSDADATVVPLADLTSIGARLVDSSQMRGVYGPPYRVDIYEVGLQIGSLGIPKIYAVAVTQDQSVILGRDASNQFVATLNGLASVVEISN